MKRTTSLRSFNSDGYKRSSASTSSSSSAWSHYNLESSSDDLLQSKLQQLPASSTKLVKRKSDPIQFRDRLQRDFDEHQWEVDQQAAEFRDYCMYTRLVSGMMIMMNRGIVATEDTTAATKLESRSSHLHRIPPMKHSSSSSSSSSSRTADQYPDSLRRIVETRHTPVDSSFLLLRGSGRGTEEEEEPDDDEPIRPFPQRGGLLSSKQHGHSTLNNSSSSLRSFGSSSTPPSLAASSSSSLSSIPDLMMGDDAINHHNGEDSIIFELDL